jgi:hypothetical protein
MLTRPGEELVAMGARICFSWDAASWRMYAAVRLSNQLCAELTRVCTGKNKALPKDLARYLTTIALTLRADRFGALLVVSSSEEMIGRLISNRQEAVSPVEALYSSLFAGRPLCKLSPQLVCNAASLDAPVIMDGNGLVI